jgi:DNA-binding NarL/FixJ family response regulator
VLTGREVEVLALVAMGLTDRQIASRLGISEATVHHHLSNTYFKLSAVNRTQAVVIAIKLGHPLDG